MSHRSKYYEEINAEAEALFRELTELPSNYRVIFVQGGASTQFEAVPLNLLSGSGKADYIATGNFASKAYSEAQKYGDIKLAATSKEANYTYIPDTTRASFRSDADYVHITTNNTIFGTRYTAATLPDTGSVPIVADMSSNIVSERMDFSKYGVVYAGAQKNIAPGGLTIVVVRDDLASKSLKICPTMLKWETQIKENSLYNTPPAFCVYVAMLVFRWLKLHGGVGTMQKVNEHKARILYDAIDNSNFYTNKIKPRDRSLMNIPFITPSEELDAKFVKEASATGLVTLKGHRLVGGMRASIYNAMPVEGVQKLIEFMKQFELANR